MIAALVAAGPAIYAGVGALAVALLALWAHLAFRPKGPTVAQSQAAAATAQAGQVVALEQASVSKAQAVAQGAMAAAVVEAPTSQAGVVDSLNKGEF